MTPLELAGGFATIVALIGQFKQERKDASNQQHQNFFEWLEYHRHEDLKNLIVKNAALLNEVNQLLKADTGLILARVNEMNRILTNLASQFEEFNGIVRVITRPDSMHPETFTLLRELVEKRYQKFLLLRPDDGNTYLSAIIRGRGGDVVYNQNHLEEDIDALVTWGFLRRSYDARGGEVFILTREAETFVVASGKSR